MSPKSYLNRETPSKTVSAHQRAHQCSVPSAPISVTAATTVPRSHLRELPRKSLISRSYSQRGCFQRPNLIKMLCAVTHAVAILWKKKISNSTMVKAEFLVKEKRILNLIRQLFWPMPWICSEVHCYNSLFLIVFKYSIISWNIK